VEAANPQSPKGVKGNFHHEKRKKRTEEEGRGRKEERKNPAEEIKK